MRRLAVSLLALFAALLAGRASAVPAANPASGQFLFSFGQSGAGPGSLDNPFDVVEGLDGRLYVADKGNNRIQVFTSSGGYLFQFGGGGTGPGQFNGPSSLAVDANHNIIVVDTFNHRIQTFTSEGTFLDSFGLEGPAAGQFSFPNGVALDAAGNYYVSDTGNNRVQVFSAAGQHRLTFGQACTGAPTCPPDDFHFPIALAVDADGRILVADETNQGRIQIFAHDGALLTQFSTAFPNPIANTTPSEVEIDSRGFLFVADAAANHLSAFRPDGQPLFAFGSTGFGAGMFRNPSGFGITSQGRIAVADSHNDRIQVFAIPEPATAALSIIALATLTRWRR